MKVHHRIIDIENDYTVNAGNYYKTNSSHIKMCFKLGELEVEKEKCCLVLTIETRGGFYYGVQLYKMKDGEWEWSELDKVSAFIPKSVEAFCNDNKRNRRYKDKDGVNRWLFWTYFTVAGEEKNFFRECKGIYEELYDPSRFVEMIDGFIEEIASEFFDENKQLKFKF